MNRDELRKLAIDLKNNQEEAFIKLYQEFYRPFFFMALKLCNNEADAQDAVQDAFINIRNHANSLKNPELLIVWMKQILFNRCKNMFRKSRDLIMDNSTLDAINVLEHHEEYLPQEYIATQNNREILLKLLSNLPYIYREPLLLKYYDGAKMDEIGAILDIPTGTVKSRLRTGKAMLRKEVKRYEEINHDTLSFHMCPFGVFLYLCMKKENALGLHLLNINKFSNSMGGAYATFVKTITGISLLSIGGIGTSLVMNQYQKSQENQMNQIQFEKEVKHITDQNIYFYIKKQAHCKDDVMKLNDNDFHALIPYVEQLKKQQGAFYQLLVKDGWIAKYEARKNK